MQHHATPSNFRLDFIAYLNFFIPRRIKMSTTAIAEILRELSNALVPFDDLTPFDIRRDEMLTTKEVCSSLKIDRTTLYRWLNSGKFPEPININGKKRWPSSLINARIYEDNPQLREREHLMAEARRITKKSGAAA